MESIFIKTFIGYFVLLLASLVIIKMFLITYRIAIKKWPPSAKFLMGIVEWDKEAVKLGILVLLAALITIIRISSLP